MERPVDKSSRFLTSLAKCGSGISALWKDRVRSKKSSKSWKRMTAILTEAKGFKLYDLHEKMLAERLGWKTGDLSTLEARIKAF